MNYFVLIILLFKLCESTELRPVSFEMYDPVTDLDWLATNISLSLSAQAYCDPSSYLTRTFTQYSEGFIPTYRIFDKSYDINGFIGYLPAHSSIYVVFRGSQSFQNFVEDMELIQSNYTYCDNCKVHSGFLASQLSIEQDALTEVNRLQSLFPDYQIVVTGHSLGAALATLFSVTLYHNGIKNPRLFNFGSPRIGNINTAAYISELLPDINRITNHKDAVPHLPPHSLTSFVHIAKEWYYDQNGMHACEGFEDPKCSSQWFITSISDHMLYIDTPFGKDKCKLGVLVY